MSRIAHPVRLAAAASALALAGCDLYFPGHDTHSAPPPDAYLACGGCDAAIPRVDAVVPDAAPWPDAGACGAIEAGVLPAPGWGEIFGGGLHGAGLTAWSAGASVTFSFVGSGLGMRYETGTDQGVYDIRIDGGEPIGIDAHTIDNLVYVTSTLATGLPYQAHTVTVTCVSLDCNVDDFPLACVPP